MVPIRVIQVVSRMDRGGVESWLMHMLRAMDRDRFRFTFCTLSERSGAFDAEIQSLGGEIVRCPVAGRVEPFSTRFLVFLRARYPSVVHSHLLFFSGRVLKSAAKAGVPTRIAHAHTTRDGHGDDPKRKLYRFLMRRMIRRYATHGIACSAEAADFLFPPPRKKRPVFVSPCTIDVAPFRTTMDRYSLLSSLGVPTNATVVGHVGSFREAKNHAFLLHVAAAMCRQDERVHLLLVGDGSLRREMEVLAGTLGITRRVTFAGVRNDVPALMRSAMDLFLFPSLYEGLPLVMVEAQCAGVPCIVSDSVTREATVVDSLVHRFPLSDGPEAWAGRCLAVLREPRMDREAARMAVEQSPFNVSAGAAFLEGLYAGHPASMLGTLA